MTYYYCTNGDGTTNNGFRPFANGDIATAPDWDPNPKRECGGGLHVVTGHPLKCLPYVLRAHPVFYEVDVYDVLPELGGKHRCRSLRRLRDIPADDPLFGSAVLDRLTTDPDWRMRRAAVERITNPAVLDRLTTDPDWRVRRAAVERITNPAVLDRLTTDPDWRVRMAVVKRITNPAVLERVVTMDYSWAVRSAAAARIRKLKGATKEE